LRDLTVLQAINEGIREEMERDERIILIGEDLWGLPGGPHGVYKGLPEQFGTSRVIQTPIAESALMGATIGAAATGMRPIVEIMHMDFMTIAMDQIVNHAAKLRYMTGGQATLPLVMRTPAGSGQGNAAQHSQSLEAWLVHVPGIKVVMPSTPYDAKGLIKSAIRDNNPVMYIEHKVAYNRRGPVPEEEYLIPLGKADIKREGTDVTVIATAYMVYVALEAADELARDGISVEIVDPRTLNPLDIDTLVASVRKTKRFVVVHEANKTCGVGAEILSRIVETAFTDLDAPPRRVCGEDVPIPYNRKLEALQLPTVKRIADAVVELCSY
jgi:pyruvate/2-oxoglutarate/acetoin dehydrogenase E1 component